jgi:peptidoglycan/LPS O-acetylase OafA/YrhL
LVVTPPSPVVTPRSDNSAPRLAYIEGLRALAALWVLLSHMWISQFRQGAHAGLLGFASDWLLYSHLAVDVFIVLSGYCLYLPVQRDGGLLRAGPKGFWRRRARRILPPMYFALAFAVVITLVLQRLDGVPLQIDIRALGVNLLLLQDAILPDNRFDGPLWSVAVEWRLSLVFPLLVWGLRRLGRPVMLLAAATVGYVLTGLVIAKAPGLLLSCPWYLLLFMMGLCAASLAPDPLRLPTEERPSERRWWLFGVAVSVASLAMLLRAFPVTVQGGNDFGRHMPSIDAAAGLLATLVLIGLRRAFDNPNAWAPRCLSWPPLDRLGRFSYSLYLTHEPLIRLLVRLMRLCPVLAAESPLLRFGVLVGLGTPILIGLAYLFFLLCERPFITSRRAIVNTDIPKIVMS